MLKIPDATFRHHHGMTLVFAKTSHLHLFVDGCHVNHTMPLNHLVYQTDSMMQGSPSIRIRPATLDANSTFLLPPPAVYGSLGSPAGTRAAPASTSSSLPQVAYLSASVDVGYHQYHPYSSSPSKLASQPNPTDGTAYGTASTKHGIVTRRRASSISDAKILTCDVPGCNKTFGNANHFKIHLVGCCWASQCGMDDGLMVSFNVRESTRVINPIHAALDAERASASWETWKRTNANTPEKSHSR